MVPSASANLRPRSRTLSISTDDRCSRDISIEKQDPTSLDPHKIKLQDRRMAWLQPYRSNSRPALITMERISLNSNSLTPQSSESQHEVLKHKLEFLWDMIFGIDLLVVFLVSTFITMSVENIGSKNHLWLSFFSESKAAIATLGAFYSFALVFRTNICYARWWEGRNQWGTLIVNAIRITQQGRLWIEDEKLVDRLSCMAIAFSYSCKSLLRGNSINHEDEEGAKLVLRGVLAQEELDMIDEQSAWQPYYFIDAMRAVINEGVIKDGESNFPEWRKQAADSAMEITICTLATCIGGCIRVKSTGLPVAYDDILNTMGVIFFLAACIAWAPGAGFYNPIIVLVAYIIVKMIIGVGNDMEDPFGYDESDLPLEQFCATVEKQINAIDERADMLTYNLAYGPSLPAVAVQTKKIIPLNDIEHGMMSETTPLVGQNNHK